MDFFENDSYVGIIKEKISENTGSRGYQTTLAKVAGIQTSYFSAVLGERSHLSLEQGARLAEFWDLNSLSSDYFLALIARDRSTSDLLRGKFQRDLENIRRESRQVYRRLIDTENGRVLLSREDSLFYTSHWAVPAIHALVKTEGQWTHKAIVERFRLEDELVALILNKLETLDLAYRDEDVWKHKSRAGISEPDKLLRKVGHGAMRECANQRIVSPSDKNFHLSGFVTVARDDYERIKKELESSIQNVLQLCRDSKSEEVVALCFDFFTP